MTITVYVCVCARVKLVFVNKRAKCSDYNMRMFCVSYMVHRIVRTLLYRVWYVCCDIYSNDLTF